MHHFATRSLLASLAVAALATPALAQPANTEVATAPGAAEPASGNNVNTLNDQLVPVGDNNRYQHDYKKFNVSTNPLGWVFGSYGVSGSYAVHKNVAVRGDLNYYAPPGDDLGISGMSIGVGAPIYFRKVYSGLFLEPGFQASRVDCDTCEDSATVAGPNIQIGYHWYWDSGLNVAAALGAGRNWNSTDDEHYDDYDDVYATGYLRFGYAF